MEELQQQETIQGVSTGSHQLPLTFEDFIAKEMEPYYRMSKAYSITNHTTNEDYEKLEKIHEGYAKGSHWMHKQYAEQLVLSYDSDDIEMQQTYLIVNNKTGEVINESHHVLTRDYITEKRKEESKVNYRKSKIKKKHNPKSGIRGTSYKTSHRHTRVFSKVNTGLSLKNQGIFSLLIQDLSPYENIISKQGNDKSFTSLSTKEIQDTLGLSKDDLKKFKAEAKKLGVITDVKLEGRQVGIRVNPAYAMNGHQFSNDLYESFKESEEFMLFIKDENDNG